MRGEPVRTVIFWGGALLAAAALGGTIGSGWTRASADPTATKVVVLENERVRAHAIIYPPGASGPRHEHTVPRVVVVLEGGRLEIRDAAGEVKTLDLKSGDVVWRPAEAHAIANVGPTTVRLVEIDILDCPRPWLQAPG